MTFVRRDCPSLPELLCLKYYRAESDGWRDSIHCGSCVARLQNRLRPMTRCLRPNDCSCTIYRRQPPSLLASASNTLSIISRARSVRTDKLGHIRSVCYSGTFAQGTHSVTAPSRLPRVRLRFRSDAFSYKLHHHCPGNGTWDVEMKRTFGSEIEAIKSLAVLKNLFCCRHYRKGLFFSTICLHHPVF